MSHPPRSDQKSPRPTRLLRPLQDAWLGGWSKLMNQTVQSDTVNKLMGAYVDTYLRTLEPIQQMVEHALEKTMHQLQLPTRREIAVLATRMTNMEKKLDDILTLLEERQGEI
jgi:hypothetical protein